MRVIKMSIMLISLSIVSASSKYKPSLHTIKIEGGVGFDYFYVNLYVGTPPQRQALIIDTGSTITTFPCTCIFIILKYNENQFIK